jgi:tyrosine-protein kinase
MTLEQFWMILVKRWWFILICILLVGLGAYIGSKQLPRLYQSSVLVQILIRSSNNQADYNSLLASDELLQTEAQLAISDPVLSEVARYYPAITMDQLARETSSTTRTGTQLFAITVQDPDPQRAAVLANDIAATFIKQQQNAAQQKSLQAQQLIQQDLDATQQQIEDTTYQIAALQSQGASQAQLSIAQIKLNGLQQHYTQSQVTLAQEKLAEAQSSSFLQIVQPAQPSLRPAQPNNFLNTAIGLFTGFVLGIALVVLFELLDTRVRNLVTLNQLLGWPVLVTIWRARSSRKEDVFNPTRRDINIEAYRILRTNIEFSAIERPLRTLVVTSALPHEGKSSVAANLAISMARVGHTTLLIDADLRHPSLQPMFGLSDNIMGLSNAILAFSTPISADASSYDEYRTSTMHVPPSSKPSVTPVSLDRFIHAVDFPNLFILPSGPLPPNPPELLGSKAMQRLCTALGDYGADVVIFDSPPLLGLSDARILASKVDGTLVVVDITRAQKKILEQLKALLTQAGVYVPGCVVNKQRPRRSDRFYSYYYGADEGDDEGVQNSNKMHSQPVSPATPDIYSDPGTSSQPDQIVPNGTKDLSPGSNKIKIHSALEIARASDETIHLPRNGSRQDEQDDHA